jgi:predicted flavoprotein YhiN
MGFTSPLLTFSSETGETEREKDMEQQGKIAFVHRGLHGLALYQLALSAQSKGAIAVVIVDNVNLTPTPRCEKGYDQKCIPGATKAFGEGFAMADIPSVW